MTRPGTPTHPANITAGTVIYEPFSNRPLEVATVTPYAGPHADCYGSVATCTDGTAVPIAHDDDRLNWPYTLTPHA